MKTVILHGHLRKFGTKFNLDVKSPAEAVRALCVLCKGFRQHLETHSEPGYRVLVGKEERGVEDIHFPTQEFRLRMAYQELLRTVLSEGYPMPLQESLLNRHRLFHQTRE